MKDCLFCKIVAGTLPSQKVFENEQVLGFKDIHPNARIHNIFIHKSHSTNLLETSPQELTDIFAAIKEYSEQENLSENGLRIVTNVGINAGQSVFHTHFHLLGGEKLGGFGA